MIETRHGLEYNYASLVSEGQSDLCMHVYRCTHFMCTILMLLQ